VPRTSETVSKAVWLFGRFFLRFERLFQPGDLGDQGIERELLLGSHGPLGLGHEETALEQPQLFEISLIGSS
jgi:hypothetical protein